MYYGNSVIELVAVRRVFTAMLRGTVMGLL